MRNGNGGSRIRIAAVTGTVLLAGALIAACSSSSASNSTTTSSTSGSSSTASTTGTTGPVPGVTATQITVGAVSTLTGSIASNFYGFAPGLKAYFDTVNAAGGVFGRKLVLAYNLDDGGNPTTFTQLAHTLVQQDGVFAVGTSTYWFTPNLFAQTNTPTYGYNVSGNWEGPNNLFAAGGSVQNYQVGDGAVAYLVKQTRSKSVAVVSYGPAIASSYNACHADAQNLSAAGINVSYTNLDAQLGGDFSSAVQKMQQAGSDFVMTCMQASDNITMSRAIQQYGLHMTQLWFDGYDNSVLSHNQSLMQGVYLNVNGSVPFQVTKAFPGKYPGVESYLTNMAKYAPNFTYSQEALQGWESGALLVAGIKAAGPNFTQQSVINATNQITNFTAGGVADVTDWTAGHTTTTYPNCSAFVQVKGNAFVPSQTRGSQVFVCFPQHVNLKNPALATPPAGTPGT